MKSPFILFAICAVLILGCAPSNQGPPTVEATPTATAADETITEMDFESGGIEPPAETSKEPVPKPESDDE